LDVVENNLAKVLNYYNLYEESAEYKIVCPFHRDINPSMLISFRKDKQFFHCFGCGASGNAADFVRYANPGMNQIEVLQEYHKILKSKKSKSLKLVNYDAIEKDIEYFEDQLLIAENYYYCLAKTKWSKMNYEDLGYQTKKYLNKRGFDDKTLSKVGARYTYHDSYSVIFPMLDNGTFRGWVCRTTVPEIEKRRKYLYNKGFSRKETLVGNYGGNDVVIVVEGYMDMISFIKAGHTNVVAILGWKMSDKQIQKLKDAGIKYIVSALDNDACGRKGTKFIKKYFSVIRFQFPEDVKDPGDMNKEQIQIAVESARRKYRRLKNVVTK